MRIRKEISLWSFKAFLIAFSIMFIIITCFYVGLALAGGRSFADALQWKNSPIWLFLPLLQAITYSWFARKNTIYINDFTAIADFQSKVKSTILSQDLAVEAEQERTTHYKPTHWFYRLFNSWAGVENLRATWNNEIVLQGSQRKISQIKDSLWRISNFQ